MREYNDRHRTMETDLIRSSVRMILPVLALFFVLFLAASPASAATLRLVVPSDTAFAPGVTDDTFVVGDTFILELWIDATDTNVNGLEASLEYDGTQLELLESSKAGDSFPPTDPGINSDEDHSVFGDILANSGGFTSSVGDTAHYAALTTADSASVDTRVARFTFQVRTTATGNSFTYITYKQSASDTTAITAATAGAENVLTGTDSGVIRIGATPDTHIVLTAVSPGYTGASDFEYISIFNPTDATVDLSNYYLSDDQVNYSSTPTGSVNAASGDWITKFPNGASIGSGETITVALRSSTVHSLLPGVKIDYEILELDGAADGVADMTLIDQSGTPGLTNSGEVVILFYWDGASDLVQDVDIVAYGTGSVPNKTGVSVDGPDGDAVASTYNPDSASMTNVAAPGVGQVIRRTNFIQGDTATNERRTGATNGLTGHDETSESVSISWAVSNDTVPYHEMVVASKIGNYASAIAEAKETGVEGLYFNIRPAMNRVDTLVQFDVTTLGTADTGNIDTMSLWIDLDGDSRVSGGDSFVGNLSITSAFTWRFTGNVGVDTLGQRFILGFQVGDTVENGETVQLRIDSGSIGMASSDTGSFVALLNDNTVTLSAGVLKVTKLTDIGADTFFAGDTRISVLSVRITGVGNDTLQVIALDNLGNLNDSDVIVQLWRDADESLSYTAGDTLAATLPYNSVTGRWEGNGLDLPLVAGGDTFVFTISAYDTAASEGDTFQATVPANSSDGELAETGPLLAVTNVNAQLMINRPGIANHIVIGAVYPDAVTNDGAGEWLLLYNPTDTPQNVQNWTLRDNGGIDVTLPDSTIAAHGWFLISDVGFVKDNPNWPDADYQEDLVLNNSNEGISLFDSNAVVVDRFGYGTETVDKEGNPKGNPGTNNYDIFVRRPHTASTVTDLLIGGRDEFGGMGYDSYDNAADFILITGTDTNNWTLRSSASPGETPALKTTVVKIFSDVPSIQGNSNETGVLAGRFFIQGDTSAIGTLTDFRVEATDTIADTNFTRVALYHDANNDGLLDGGDVLVADLQANGDASWDSSAMNFSFNALAGESFLLTLDIAATVTDFDTFQARITTRTIDASGADSGPSVVRTSAGIITLRNLSPLVITQNAPVGHDTVAPTADTLTVIAFRVSGDAGGDTLTKFTIDNLGTLDSTDIVSVRLFRDADGDSRYSTGDTFVSTLTAVSPTRWQDTTLTEFIGAFADFVVTIDLGTAGNGESFIASIPANSANATVADTGPAASITETGVITVSAAQAINMILTEVKVEGTSPVDYIELLVVDDGNNGAGVDISGWRIEEPGSWSKIFGDATNNGTVDSVVIAATGDRIVVFDADATPVGNDDTDSGGNGIIQLYDGTAMALSPSDDVVILYDNTGTGRDGVAWSNRDGSPISTFEPDFLELIGLGLWQGSATQSNAVNPRSGTTFTGGMSLQRSGTVDRDTYLDWGEADRTQGTANTVEDPPTPPARLTGIDLNDVPNDLGGALRVSWTPDTLNADFLEYRVYLETEPLTTLLDSNVLPRATVTDSGASFRDISGLTDGDSYYAVVTGVDSWGLEFRFGLNDTGPATPVKNVTGSPKLVINEVNVLGTGGNADTDYIEIFVQDDGNPTGDLNISGWKVDWHSAGSKTLGSVTVTTGDYILLEFESSLSDDADSSGDGVVNLYDSSDGLVGTDGYVRIRDSFDSIIDFMFYVNQNQALTAAVGTAVQEAIDSSHWVGAAVENAGVNAAGLGAALSGNDILARDAASSDTFNSRDDWNVTTARSKGAQNSGVESPITIPDSRDVTIFRDLPDDFGGTLEIGWDTTTALPDFVRYNVYLETQVIGARIDTSLFTPRQTVTDSSAAMTTVSGLIDGANYWLVVTVTDSWGHELRTNLTDTGPVTPVQNVTGTPNLLISEVRFAGTDTEFIEIRVIDDANPGGNLNIAGFRVAQDDTVAGDIYTFGSVTVGDSDFIVLWNTAGTNETDSGGDGVINIYNVPISLPESDEGIFLMQSDTILDFVFWSSVSGSMTASERTTDLPYAIAEGAWANLGATQRNARNPLPFDGITDFKNGYSITRSAGFHDNNGDTDWAIDTPTPGALPSIAESPFAAPAAVTGTVASDVPNDLGGQLRLVWDASAAPDLHHYAIYRDTTVIPTSLYQTDSAAFDTVPLTDTSASFGGLVNGETYYFAVTAVDSWGNELKTGLLVDSAVPVGDISGETLLITEVSFAEGATGVLGYDWIEIQVVGDGNNGAGIDLTGWNVVTSGSGNNDKSLTGVTAHTGDFILIHGTAGADESDSMAGNGDGIIDLYLGGGLTGTDNTITLYRPFGDTEDFVGWTSPAGSPVNAADSVAFLAAIAAGEWSDSDPSGVGVEDGVNSDSVAANVSIARTSTTNDSNSKFDFGFDSSPTPGYVNDSVTYWRVVGTLDLDTRANDGGVTVLLGNGVDTFVAVTDASGSFTIRAVNGSYTLSGDTDHYLRKAVTGVVVNNLSLLNQNVGTLTPGDANNDNRIDIFDAAMTKFAVDFGTNAYAADHVDPVGTVDEADLAVIREHFGEVGD